VKEFIAAGEAGRNATSSVKNGAVGGQGQWVARASLMVENGGYRDSSLLAAAPASYLAACLKSRRCGK